MEQGTGKQRGAEEGQAAKVFALDTKSHLQPSITNALPHPSAQETAGAGQRGLLCSPGWVFKHHMEALH